MFKNIEGEFQVEKNQKEEFKNVQEIKDAIKGLMGNLSLVNETVQKVFEESDFKYPSSRFKVKLLETLYGRTCSTEDFRKAESAFPEFDQIVKKIFFKLNGVEDLQKQKGLLKNEVENNIMGQGKITPYDPNKKYSWNSHAGHSLKD